MKIRTQQTRRLRSRHLGEMLIQHTYVDRPASIEMWDKGAVSIANEFGLAPNDIHRMLMRDFPEMYGLLREAQ